MSKRRMSIRKQNKMDLFYHIDRIVLYACYANKKKQIRDTNVSNIHNILS